MPASEIIAIGTELLLGEIQDTNTRYLARTLRDLGIDLYRTMIVGDNAERIASTVRESLKRCQIIITTGGLGPTVDDPTRQAIAMAVDTELEFRPELWDQIQNRFQRYGRQATENNRRQAWIPKGALPVENPVGTAPSFIVEKDGGCIISLPGVPREMEYLLQNAVIPYLKSHFTLQGTIKARVLHASGMGESQIDEWIGDLETLSNPTVGLLAHPGQCDIRITAKADSIEEADQMIKQVEEQIRQRLGDTIFGCDQDTLESAAARAIQQRRLKLGIIEAGNNSGEITSRLKRAGVEIAPERIVETSLDLNEVTDLAREMCLQTEGLTVFVSQLIPGPEKQVLNLALVSQESAQNNVRSWGGPPPLGPQWAVHMSLDFLRRL